MPDFDEEDPGAEHPLYVKNKDEVLESWKMKVTDADFSSANE